MEGENVRVVDSDSDDELGARNPAHRSWIAAGTAIGFLVVALLFSGPLAGDEPLREAPDAAPAPPTTSVPPPTTTRPFTTTASATAGLLSLARRDICAEPGECPSFDAAVPGDNGMGPLPLGSRNDIPNEDRLDFLFGNCRSGCDLDAHFVFPDNPVFGSGPSTSGRPFHLRHGFINEASEPLGEGFNVTLYISRTETLDQDDPPEVIGADEAGFEPGVVYQYTPDYVLRAASDRCGPAFDSQTISHPCEWFAYDFPDGLPAGRFTLWAVWEAPCSAWLELGFVESCEDPAQVISISSRNLALTWVRLFDH